MTFYKYFNYKQVYHLYVHVHVLSLSPLYRVEHIGCLISKTSPVLSNAEQSLSKDLQSMKENLERLKTLLKRVRSISILKKLPIMCLMYVITCTVIPSYSGHLWDQLEWDLLIQ